MSSEVVALASKTFSDVTAAISEFVGTAQISRPPDNFFDAELIGSLADAYEWLDEQGARAIVLGSVGKHFCAGADFTGRSSAGRIGSGSGAGELYEQALRLFRAPLPVVAAVQGVAVGGGLGLACAADFRVASPQSRFSANFARIGLHQGFALSVTLPAIVGQHDYTGHLLQACLDSEGRAEPRCCDVHRWQRKRVHRCRRAGELQPAAQ